MSDNLSVWEKFEKTDPKYTKPFDNGKFKGTAINPTYQIRKMTEQFGQIGIGWGYAVKDTHIVPIPTGEITIYVTVSVWIKGMTSNFEGVGGDFIYRKFKSSDKVNDEAMKSATTDALMNAFKFLGMSADVYMGRYDDNKYVESLKDEQSKGNGTISGRLSDDPTIKADMKELGYDADKVYNEAMSELDQCQDLEMLAALVKKNKDTGRMKGLPTNLKSDFTDNYNKLKLYLENKNG